MLPFDAETLHANLGQYNLAFWPASIVGLLLGLALIGLCLRPRAGAGRAGAAILVAEQNAGFAERIADETILIRTGRISNP